MLSIYSYFCKSKLSGESNFMQMSKWSGNTQGRGGGRKGEDRRAQRKIGRRRELDENSEEKDEEKKAKNLHAEIEEAIFHNLQEVEACNSDCLLFFFI